MPSQIITNNYNAYIIQRNKEYPDLKGWIL